MSDKDATIAMLRAALAFIEREGDPPANGRALEALEATDADSAAWLAEHDAKVRADERERCAIECGERAILNDAVEDAKDVATDPHTGVVATACDHRAIEARECAAAIRGGRP